MNRLARILAATFVVAALSFGCSDPAPPAEGDPCETIADCARAEGLSCLIDTCTRVECERSSVCPAGAACVAGLCDDPECAEDADCSTDEICFEGDCRADLCSRTDDCDLGQICAGAPPQCVSPPEQCANDLECPAGIFCKLPEASCEPLCDEESDCAGDSYCDGRFCREPCLQTSECPGDSVCVEGRCTEPGDCDEVSCPVATPFTNPVDCACQECLADFDCPEGRTCFGGVCRFCPLEATNSQACDERGFLFDGQCCVECLADSDCTVGVAQTCSRGACEADSGRECGGDGDCPIGQTCDEGFCRKSGTGADCALQTDCADGEACYGDGRCWEESARCVGCAAPSRCVAEDGDPEGTCAGCTDACEEAACPEGEVCYIAPGQLEGVCIERSFTPDCR